jgi:hypothetical protein
MRMVGVALLVDGSQMARVRGAAVVVPIQVRACVLPGRIVGCVTMRQAVAHLRKEERQAEDERNEDAGNAGGTQVPQAPKIIRGRSWR